MSTELQPSLYGRARRPRRWYVPPGHPARRASLPLAIVALLTAACAPRLSPQLSAICEGRSVVQALRISVDSLTQQAGPALQQLRGRSATLTLTLLNEIDAARCVDQAGVGTWTGELPAALETATDPERRASWNVTGEEVVVNLNPFVVDNNLTIALPLDGGPGSWSLSTLAGPVASGRATTPNGIP